MNIPFDTALFRAELPLVSGAMIVFTIITTILMIVLHWYGHTGRGVIAGLVSSAIVGVLCIGALALQCCGVEPYFLPYTLHDKYPEFAVNLMTFALIIVQLIPVLAPSFWVFWKLQKWSEPQKD